MFTGVCLSTGGGESMVRGGGWSGWGLDGPGGWIVETPPSATAAGGTHPTGMHSCLLKLFKKFNM